MINPFRNLFTRRRQDRLNDVMVNLIDMYQARRPLASLWDVREFTNAGYRRNTVVFACVTIKATAFMAPELMAYRTDANGNEEALGPDSGLARLLAKGYGNDSQSAFMRRWCTCLDVAGNAYALKVRSQAGIPVQLKILRPDCIRPIPNDNGDIIAYEYGEQSSHGGYSSADLEKGRAGSGTEAQVIPADSVIHEQAHPDPLDPYHGLSPMAVLARFGDLDNFAADYLRSFFLNAGIPSGILKVKSQMKEDQRQAVREKWKERYSLRSWTSTAAGGAFDLAVIDADVEYQEVGSKLKMMDLGQVFGETESRICATFGVHPILAAVWIGLMRSTMDNYKHARMQLYNDTLLPRWISTADRFGLDLGSEFGEDGNAPYCRFDLSEVPELQRDRTEEKRLFLQAWNDGLATKNEAREDWGLPGDAYGDIYKIGVADDFIPAATAVSAGSVPKAGQLPPAREDDEGQMGLLGPGETHATDPNIWKLIQGVSAKAQPALKKKY